jgi:hypothetical protein
MKTHVWKGACVGFDGKLLRQGRAFDPSDFPGLDLGKAVAAGKAEMVSASEIRPVNPNDRPIPTVDPGFVEKADKKGKR